ncbi:MAG: SAM-dependent methyltransferase [Solirubrobacterales bacterium]|jgi:23S rRNA (cytidine1920-2'-O)/16S rRNA (cytidine1409-2'-O)-methyltransferase
MGERRPAFRNVLEVVARARPDATDIAEALTEGRVLVDGRVITNPNALVRTSAAIRLVPRRRLRGESKLRFALDRFEVFVDGRAALDIGAAAGGFTAVLLERGARLVYAVDAGFGQLRGDLRANRRVVVLERTNLGELGPELIPGPVEIVTLDLSYLAIAAAVPQLYRLRFRPEADLLALVKPTFELGSRTLAAEPADLARAMRCAADGIERGGWAVLDTAPSPIRGGSGALEGFVHARWVS